MEAVLGGAVPHAWVRFLETVPDEFAGKLACMWDELDEPETAVLVPLDLVGLKAASWDRVEPGSRCLPILLSDSDDILMVLLSETREDDPPVWLQWHDGGDRWPIDLTLSALLARLRPRDDQ